MRQELAFTLISLSLAACGGDSHSTPDAAGPKDVGFNKPKATLKANMEVATNNWMEIGPADLTCLNTPSADQATTVAVTLNTVVKDFQAGTLVPGATITVFKDVSADMPFDTQTADASANATFTVPVGVKRFGFKMTGDFMPTFLLNQAISADVALQPPGSDTDSTKRMKIQSISNSTAATLPALIGETRTPGTGVLAGAMRDCQNREMSNFVATVSSTSGTATPLDGAESYYFADNVGLPVRHSTADASTKNGLFMSIQLPATPIAYVQLWGFPTDADLTAGTMKLIAELKVPVLADTVITGSYEPLRQ